MKKNEMKSSSLNNFLTFQVKYFIDFTANDWKKSSFFFYIIFLLNEKLKQNYISLFNLF